MAAHNATIDSSNDTQIMPAPEDTIQCLKFSPNPQSVLLAGCSWSNNCTIWEINPQTGQNQVKADTKQQSPCLSLTWNTNGQSIFLGGSDNQVKLWDLATSQVRQIGTHQQPVCSVIWCQELNHVISASWDGMLSFWNGQQPQATTSFNLGAKILTMSLAYPLLIACLPDNAIAAVDLSKLQMNVQPYRHQENQLFNYGIRSVCVYPDASGCAFGSHEGRVAFKKITLNPQFHMTNEYTFKCHRDNQQMAFPIHGIAIHKQFGCVATAGGDGTIGFWDRMGRTRIKGLVNIRNPVTAIDIQSDRSLLAYAVGYDWNKGIEAAGTIQPKVCYRALTEDFRPKGGAGNAGSRFNNALR